MRIGTVLSALVLSCVAAACGDINVQNECVIGSAVQCVCVTGNPGVRTCSESGTLGPCLCTAPDAAGGDAGATDLGSPDPGHADPGHADPGHADPGPADPGPGDPGLADPGAPDPGAGDPGAGDPGAGDPGAGDPGAGDPGAADPGTPDTAGPGDAGVPDVAQADAAAPDAVTCDPVANCGARECGDDGCGGVCGNCPAAAPVCSAAGLCETSCDPVANCGARECGADGCGGVCGTCPGAAPVCNAAGACEVACDPAANCTGKDCGPDGCGGTCGACTGGALCQSGGTCGCVDQASATCNGDDVWWVDSCGNTTALKQSCPFGCTAGNCDGCSPDCTGRECGNDGCGGTCAPGCSSDATCDDTTGTCACNGATCDALCCGVGEVCAGGACCQPNCGSAQCGSDGCGGSCGNCTVSGQNCSNGLCVCTPNTGEVCVGNEVHYQDSCGAVGSLIESCPLGCADGACKVACGAPTLAISQEIADDYTIIAPWQSFTATTKGELVRIETRPNAYGGGAGISGTFKIYAGEGTGGAVLSSQGYTIPSVSGAPWQTFVLTAPVPVTAGQKVTWELTGAGGIQYATGNPYSGGRASSSTLDMTMRVWIAPCP